MIYNIASQLRRQMLVKSWTALYIYYLLKQGLPMFINPVRTKLLNRPFRPILPTFPFANANDRTFVISPNSTIMQVHHCSSNGVGFGTDRFTADPLCAGLTCVSSLGQNFVDV